MDHSLFITKIFKLLQLKCFNGIVNGMSPNITNDLFEQRTKDRYNLCHVNDFNIPHIRTVYHDSESFSYLGPKVWDIFLQGIKKTKSLKSFEKLIKKCKALNCPCRLCKT